MIFYKTYTHATSSEWLVFVHGAGSNSSAWFKQIKELGKYFNLLLVDLRGHGRSREYPDRSLRKDYTFEEVSQDVIQVLKHLKIEAAHFIGISLGTLIIRTIAELEPQKVKTMIMGGAITGLNWFTRFMIIFASIAKYVVPFFWLYALCAYILMPGNKHKEARLHFIKESKKLEQPEFLRWFALTISVRGILKKYQHKAPSSPTLYLMGRDDLMFLASAEKNAKYQANSSIKIFENCGHVCNFEQPDLFNKETLLFVNQYITKK